MNFTIQMKAVYKYFVYLHWFQHMKSSTFVLGLSDFFFSANQVNNRNTKHTHDTLFYVSK